MRQNFSKGQMQDIKQGGNDVWDYDRWLLLSVLSFLALYDTIIGGSALSILHGDLKSFQEVGLC